jgi:hypothetical protein
MRSRNVWVYFLVVAVLNSSILATPSSAAAVIAQGSFSENSNGEGAPVSKSDSIGNIKKLNVMQSSDATLKVTIDFWKLPSSNHTVRIRWCAPDQFEDYDGMGICNPSDKNWLNNLVFYSPAKTSKGYQLGLRKSFVSTSKKGANSNQWIYTIKGASLAGKPMGLVEVLMLYSSTKFTEVTTTCRGGYSITCNTRSSNVFERDAADVKLIPTSQVTSSNQPYSRQFLRIQDYFDKITGTFSPSTRQFNLVCNSNARTDGIIEGLRLFMGISSSTSGVKAGQEWFPKQLTPLYASIAKTWVQDGAPYIMYIEIPFISPDDNRNPCGLNAAGIPKLNAIGNDVESTIFLLAGPNGFAIASPSYIKSIIG